MNPIHPNPASPPQSDSIDALFSMEAADVVVDSLMSEGKKRGREGDAVVEETPQVQRRRFTRNPRIGLGLVFTINLKTQSWLAIRWAPLSLAATRKVADLTSHWSESKRVPSLPFTMVGLYPTLFVQWIRSTNYGRSTRSRNTSLSPFPTGVMTYTPRLQTAC